jgi:hypothetical protein
MAGDLRHDRLAVLNVAAAGGIAIAAVGAVSSFTEKYLVSRATRKLVADVMTPSVVTVKPHTPVCEAVALMRGQSIGSATRSN